MTVEIRDGVAADLPALTEIYNHYVESSPATFDLEPFTVEARQDWLRHYSVAGPHRLLVAAEDGEVVGYTTSSRLRPKAAYDPSVEVTVYLRPTHTGGGIGAALYERLFGVLRDEGLHRAYAAITQPNQVSVALHRRFGFTEVGTMTEVGRKFGQWWDVLMMQRALP